MHNVPDNSALDAMPPARVRPGLGGFTLVELLAVLAVIGTLVGMLLPAVLRVRESGRQTQCGNNIHNISLGVLSYASARRTYPPGSDNMPAGAALPNGTQHAWSSFILPYVEEAALAARIDFKKHWNASGGNDVVSDAILPLYVCPSGMTTYLGKQDYGGIMGTVIVPSGQVDPAPDPFANGMLFAVDIQHPARITPAQVTDGLSYTLLVGESVDRGLQAAPDVNPDTNIRWAWGTNCFSQNVNFINVFENQCLRSRHLRGAQTAFADGRVMFLSDTMDPDVLAAICTRNGGEVRASSVNGQ